MGPYDMYGNFQMPQMPRVYDGTVEAVNGINGAKALNLKPGASVIVPDSCEPLMYFVSANQFGVKTVTTYPYGDPIESTQTKQQANTSNDTPVYVQQSEFDILRDQVSTMQSQLSKLVEELK